MPGSLLLPSTDNLAQISNSRTQMRQQFESALLAITGDTRLFWMAQSDDTTTSTGKSLNAGTITWDATVASRLSALGLGYAQTFNGTSQYGTIPDNDIYSFGTGTADSAFSIFALANITDTAALRTIVAKFGGVANEWELVISSADKLQLALYDQSAAVSPNLTQTTATTHQGAWCLYGATYSAATGGATAANDMALYENGLAVAGTAGNNASYVAMENLGSAVAIGSNSAHSTGWYPGSLALVALVAKAMSASEMWAAYKLIKGYYNY